MISDQRVVASLNAALHAAMADDQDVFLLGQDILDPYGGAFKATRGLSTRFPERVLNTPISEQATMGFACGLALCGHKPIVEIMFGDFIGLAFDEILNFAAKSVTMFGRRLPLNLVIRCPSGAGRGYGPTHSQQLQKHFIGIPQLSLFELSSFHCPAKLIRSLLSLGHPSIVFEDKSLYSRRMYQVGRIDDIYSCDFVDQDQNYAVVRNASDARSQCLIIAPGGVSDRCISAARQLFIENEIDSSIVIPARLYPFDVDPLSELVRQVDGIVIVEEGTTGGSWGAEIAHQIYQRFWSSLRGPIQIVCSKDSVIPSARHLESKVIVQAEDVCAAVRRVVKLEERIGN